VYFGGSWASSSFCIVTSTSARVCWRFLQSRTNFCSLRVSRSCLDAVFTWLRSVLVSFMSGLVSRSNMVSSSSDSSSLMCLCSSSSNVLLNSMSWLKYSSMLMLPRL